MTEVLDLDQRWGAAMDAVADRAHLATGHELSTMVSEVVAPLGLDAELLLVDLAQRVLTPIGWPPERRVAVEGTPAGRAYQLGDFVVEELAADAPTDRRLWVPVLDGTERAGVLRVDLDDTVVDDDRFRRHCWALAGLVGHLLMTKFAYSDRLRRLRSNGPLTPAAELLWQIVPPRTFATDAVVVSALLEPPDRVAGDAYDYAVDGSVVDLAIYDGVGHDLAAGQTTALALTAVRNARRNDDAGPSGQAEAADAVLAHLPAAHRFVTAVLARLDTARGTLDLLVAGHPPPLLVRDGRILRELAGPVQPPLGIVRPAGRGSVGREQLEPGDRVLFYSDGIVEARDADGAFFGTDRLVAFTEQAELAHLPPPETLRRLAAAVLDHQGGRLQDDATLLMLDWSAEAHRRMFPRFD